MRKLIERFEALGPTAVLGSGAAIVLLFVAAVVGAANVGDDGDATVQAGGPEDTTSTTLGEGGITSDTTPVDGATTDTSLAAGAPGAPAAGGGGGGGGGGATTGTKAPAKGTATTAAPTSGPADRTGVTAGAVKWGLHAPETFDGAPLNLAEDPLLGVQIYLDALNAAGGVNGRKIEKVFADDRYTVTGGRNAADKLINDAKVFFVSGTLGVDQIAQVATEAKKRNVPYMAAGGPESKFKDLNMFQISMSYDTALVKLADYLGKAVKGQDAQSNGYYNGVTKVGVTSLNSEYILPVIDGPFKAALQRNGLELVKVVRIEKPTEQTSYVTQCQDLAGAGAQVIVPAQDPISTSRMVAEPRCRAANFKWAMSNFANDSDVALSLMGGAWTNSRGLSAGCYYLNSNPGGADWTPQCGAMNKARRIWEQAKGKDSFEKDGQGGVAGYQVVYFWVKALKDAGTDPTREKLRAALLAYDGYNDLVSAPIKFRGSPNISHGVDSVVVYEAQSNLKWKQIGDGLTSGF